MDVIKIQIFKSPDKKLTFLLDKSNRFEQTQI